MVYPINGGKGNKFAPGASTVRVPNPLKAIVLAIIQKYKQLYGGESDPLGMLLIFRLNQAIDNPSSQTHHTFESNGQVSTASKPITPLPVDTKVESEAQPSAAAQILIDRMTANVMELERLKQENERLKDEQSALLEELSVSRSTVEELEAEIVTMINSNPLPGEWEPQVAELTKVVEDYKNQYDSSLLGIAHDLKEIAAGKDPRLAKPNPSFQRSNKVKIIEIAEEIETWVKSTPE